MAGPIKRSAAPEEGEIVLRGRSLSGICASAVKKRSVRKKGEKGGDNDE
jgi:hypothetical protein